MSSMKRKALLILPLVSPLLFACDDFNNDDTSSSSSTNISAYIDQNGDYAETNPSSYASLPVISPSSFIYRAEKGITTLFIDAHEDCSHCLKFEPICLETLKKTGFYFESLYRDDTAASSVFYSDKLKDLQAEYGHKRGEGGIDGSTPSIYLGEKDKLTLLDFYDDSGNVNKFTSYLNSLFTKTEIYHFSSFSAFSSKYEESTSAPLVLFIDESNQDEISFYADSLYELAKTSKKSLFYIDLARLDEENRSSFASYFSLSSLYSSIILKDEIVDYTKSEAEAASLITRYYF